MFPGLDWPKLILSLFYCLCIIISPNSTWVDFSWISTKMNYKQIKSKMIKSIVKYNLSNNKSKQKVNKSNQ